MTSRLARGVWFLSAISIMALLCPCMAMLLICASPNPIVARKRPRITSHCGNRAGKIQPHRSGHVALRASLNLPLINVPPVSLLFDRSGGEEFATLIVESSVAFCSSARSSAAQLIFNFSRRLAPFRARNQYHLNRRNS